MKRLLSIFCALAILCSMFPIINMALALDDDTVVALDFDAHEMTYDSVNGCWTSGAGNEATLYRWGSYSTSKIAIRKFVAPATEELTFDWGAGFYVLSGTAKFVITDKNKNIVYPQDGGYITLTTEAHVMKTTLSVEAGEELYFIGYDFSVSGTCFFPNTPILANGVQYDDLSGYLFSDANVQGDRGWYYLYADEITEVKRKDLRDMTALNSAIAEAEGYTPEALAGYTPESVNAFNTALTAAKAITKTNSQTEIDAAAAALNAAIDGLTVAIDPNEVVVALDFNAHEMTYDSGTGCWTSGAGNEATLYRWGSYSTSKIAIRKLVVSATEELTFKWGTGFSVAAGTAKFVITDKNKNIIYPAGGGYIELTTEPHIIDTTLSVTAGDELYFIGYDFSVSGTCFFPNTPILANGVQYDDLSGYLFSDANVQGDKGWYYLYADEITEVKRKDLRDMTALNEAIAEAEGYTPEALAGYTPESVNAFNTALAAAKAITRTNSQTEIDAAAAALNAAIDGLTVAIDPNEVIVALDFNEHEMTYDSANGRWTAGAGDDCTTYRWGSFSPAGSSKIAIRKFVVSATEELNLKWGAGFSVAAGTAKFVITDKNKNIIYPAGGGYIELTTEPHTIDTTLNVEAGDELYFIGYDFSDAVGFSLNTAVYGNSGSYADSGYLYSDANVQGDKGWYYLYATDLVEIKRKDLRDMTALNKAIDEAEGYTPEALAGYTPESVNAFNTALAAAKAITRTNSQTEIDAAAAALNAAIDDLTVAIDPDDVIVALDFNEHEMTYDSANGRWTAGAGDDCTTYRWGSFSPAGSSKIAIRKFVVPATEELNLKWGVGFSVAEGTAKFVITDKHKKIIYPAEGGYVTLSQTPHVLDTTLNVTEGDELYFIGYDFSVSSTSFLPNTAVYGLSGSYDDSGNLFSPANVQGDKGWYYLYATDLVEIKKKDYKTLAALNEQIAAAEAIDQAYLDTCTPESATALRTALAAAKAITNANTQVEIDAATAALKVAIKGLELLPQPEKPEDVIVALNFNEHEMTYDAANGRWTAGEGDDCTTYRWGSFSPAGSSKVAIRKFVASTTGDVNLKWGVGFSVSAGTAKFVITDKHKKIIYPAEGGYVTLSQTPHVLDMTLSLTEGDELYFIGYDFSGAVGFTLNTALYGSSGSYDDSGNLYSSANVQGDKGWYYLYATDLVEIKKKDYKTLAALNEQIAAAEAIDQAVLDTCTPESVAVLRAALATAKAITKANTQAEIDVATEALKAAIKGLKPLPISSDAKKVAFTERRMTFNKGSATWVAGNDPTCYITTSASISATVAGSGNVAMRKLVVPQSGDVLLKWGGVYIDNTTGQYTGASAEFMITDKDGNILYPTTGGAVTITEGTTHEIDFTISGLERGDALYFISCNPSMASVPVVPSFGIVQNGQVLINDAGFLYGVNGAQGAKCWYYMYAEDFRVATAGQGDSGNSKVPDGNAQTPDTGDSAMPVWPFAVLMVISSATLAWLTIKKRKGVW